MLFKIPVYRSLGNLLFEGNDSIIWYVDDICIKSSSEDKMQQILEIPSPRATEYSINISTEKSK